ncbi:MAG TPA: hypothetical protein VLH40_10095 [Atribacteraceae bacterium]|nr:hypothetical protein [Atribacteraceae bacterium]
MWFSTHVLTGLALATRIESIPLLALTGLGNHILLDMIPHRDTPTLGWAAADVVFGLFAGYLIWRWLTPGPLALWGAFFSACPDCEVLLKEWGIIRKTRFPAHNLRWHGSWPTSLGNLPNLLIGGLGLLTIIFR